MEVHCQPTRKRTEEASLEVLALLLSVEVRLLTHGIINQTMIPRFVLTCLNATVHTLWTTTWKPTTSWLGFLVSFPTWPHWPWSSHQRDLAKQRSDRVALPWEWRMPPSSPILQINPTLTRPGFQAPSSLLLNPNLEEKGAEVCPPGGPEEPESTGSPSSTAAPLPPPGESTGRNF